MVEPEWSCLPKLVCNLDYPVRYPSIDGSRPPLLYHPVSRGELPIGQIQFHDIGIFHGIGIVVPALAADHETKTLVEPDGTKVGFSNLEKHPFGEPRSRLAHDGGHELFADSGTGVTGIDGERLLAAIDELRHARVLLEHEDAGDVVYDFTHPLLQDTIYAELGLARARSLHASVAEALEAFYGARALDHADELAFHYVRADARRLAGKAVRYLRAAGRISDYSTVGSVTTWNVGGDYAPIDDIRFRATYAKSVRAPNIGELFTGPSQTFPTGLVDPCVGVTATTTGTTAEQCRLDPGVLINIADNGAFTIGQADKQGVSGFTSGGPPDTIGRIVAVKLTELLGQQGIVDNRPGAGGTMGTKIVAEATPDGHTLLVVSASYAVVPVCTFPTKASSRRLPTR